MKRTETTPTLRCAIYTRVSTDSGLEQDFNSLDNQREASEAYVKSQAHEGWKLVRDRYDDGGFSGGSMERPALQKLLEDVRARRIDIIVVYKVDRLTRSLADFAKLVELFDAQGVSFISVTQAFNTTTSMGRLTLNMLLSFAQFEREITGERIRDKVAASKRKGIWMGGAVPLGYRVEKRALHIVEDEAEFVRNLFRRYLETGSVVRLKTALDNENVSAPIRTSGAGRTTGGKPFSRGHLYWMLSNPIYIGRLRHKGQIHDGLHAAIVDIETWEKVQQNLASQTQARRASHPDDHSFLAGKLFDDRGNRMTPSHATKGGRRWRYYVSQAKLKGRQSDAGSIARVSAVEIERRVAEVVRAALPDAGRSIGNVPSRNFFETVGTSHGAGNFEGDPSAPFATIVSQHDASESEPDRTADLRYAIERVTIGRTAIEVRLTGDSVGEDRVRVLTLPWSPPSPYRRREVIQGLDDPTRAIRRPMRIRARAVLLEALREAHRWRDELLADTGKTIESLAAREGKTERSIRMTLSLAFVAPPLIKAAIEGRLPRGFGVKRLMDLPVVWSEQWSALGLRAPTNS